MTTQHLSRALFCCRRSFSRTALSSGLMSSSSASSSSFLHVTTATSRQHPHHSYVTMATSRQHPHHHSYMSPWQQVVSILIIPTSPWQQINVKITTNKLHNKKKLRVKKEFDITARHCRLKRDHLCQLFNPLMPLLSYSYKASCGRLG